MSHGINALERSSHRFISLKPRLLQRTTLAMENLAINQKPTCHQTLEKKQNPGKDVSA
jgi:hypothetical protein